MNETLAANYFKSKRRDALLNKNVSSPAVVTGIHSSSLANGHVPGNINNGTSSGKGNIASHLINNANNNNNTSNNNYLSKDNNKVSKGFHGRSNGNITLTHNIANGADGSAKLTNANNNSTTNANVNQLINGSLNGNNNLVKHPPHPHPPAPVSPVSRATSGGLFQLNGLVNSTSPSFTGRPSNFIHSSALNEFTNRSSISSSLSTLKQMPKQQVNSSNSAVERGHLTHLNLAVTGGQATVNGITHNLNQLNNCECEYTCYEETNLHFTFHILHFACCILHFTFASSPLCCDIPFIANDRSLFALQTGWRAFVEVTKLLLS